MGRHISSFLRAPVADLTRESGGAILVLALIPEGLSVSDEAKPLANHEIVTLAVYLLGGASRPADTEDVATKANEIAPGRFTWRKYKDQINLDAVRKRLWDAKSPKLGYQFLHGSESEGWSLTEAGLDFCRSRATQLESAAPVKTPTSMNDKRWMSAERSRLLSSPAFDAFKDGKADVISEREAMVFFRLDEYITGDARERKIDRIVNAFRDDAQLGPLVAALAQRLRSAPRDEE